MTVAAWFPTLIYDAPLLSRGASSFNAELIREAEQIRSADQAGRRWCDDGGYPGGYTSYASLDQLHWMSSTVDRLRRAVDRHVAKYAAQLAWDLGEGRLEMTDCWVNMMPRGCAHSFHIHPQAVVSGTYYVDTPKGSGSIKFEDPRLGFMMAAPPRSSAADDRHRAHVAYPARAGRVILFESWLRHEVPAHAGDRPRISISFNYHWIR